MGDCGAVNAGDGFSCFLVHFCSSKGGIHPRGDRKSAEGLEYKGVAERPLRQRVRKMQKGKEIDRRRASKEVMTHGGGGAVPPGRGQEGEVAWRIMLDIATEE